jgi:hypothetical protein
MDSDKPAHPHSLIRIHAVLLQTLLQVEKLIANNMDFDQTAQRRRLIWIHTGRKTHYDGFVMAWLNYCLYLAVTLYSDIVYSKMAIISKNRLFNH